MRNMAWMAFVGVCAVALAGCGGGRSTALKKGELRQTIVAEKNTGDYFEVVGLGAADPNLASSTQRKITARNAAKVDAEFQLVSMIKGVKVEGGITVQKAIETDSRITTSVDAMIKGAEVVKTEWTKDDGCAVTLRIHKKVVEKELGLKLR